MRRIERVLTEGEKKLARSVFGPAIDYALVRIVRGKWFPFQPRNVAMAPMGNIHFHPEGPLWSDDFSIENRSLQALFLHEMTHVWQTQTRGLFYLPLMRHPFCSYSYRLRLGRPFGRYGLEQQAEIVRDLFLLRGGGVPRHPVRRDELEALIPFRGD